MGRFDLDHSHHENEYWHSISMDDLNVIMSNKNLINLN